MKFFFGSLILWSFFRDSETWGRQWKNADSHSQQQNALPQL
jgi:hypothetical protein